MISVQEEKEKMGSYVQGKDRVAEYLKNRFPKGSTCLDVGACDGVWLSWLGDHFTMDAVEVWEKNAERLSGYKSVFHADVRGFKYVWYDCIIFGDVIEHMETEEAQEVLRYANDRCEDMIIAVPYLYEQFELDGNPYERHLQPELTRELFLQRYPGYEELVAFENYAYWHKG